MLIYSNPFEFSGDKCKVIPNNGDIIEMKLDLNKLTLEYKVNDEFNAEFNDIENTSYRAVVTTPREGQGFTLLSYQDNFNQN